MKKYTIILLGLVLLINSGNLQLWAAVENLQEEEHSEEVNAFLLNEFIQENFRLIKLAEDCFAESRYDEAIQYAEKALQYAQMSDDYVTLQMRIREANDTINDAKARLESAKKSGIQRGYPEVYARAEVMYAEAMEALSREDWDAALAAARQVIAILSEVPDETVLAAQYVVKKWDPDRDCLWNIAAKPEIYNDSSYWQRLYNANKNKLPDPDNPNLIRPGTILDIPKLGNERRVGRLD